MTCPICRTGDLTPSTTTVTLERGDSTVVFKHVPADVCETCGEAFLSEQTTTELIEETRTAASRGIQVEVRDVAERAAS